jgi:hypothetical protein
MVGPRLDNAAVGIDKNFNFKERYKIQIRWEIFNLTNTAAFEPPGNNPSSPGFGTITSTWGASGGISTSEQSYYGYPARVMQAAIKIYF